MKAKVRLVTPGTTELEVTLVATRAQWQLLVAQLEKINEYPAWPFAMRIKDLLAKTELFFQEEFEA